jgi:hypothetical protein
MLEKNAPVPSLVFTTGNVSPSGRAAASTSFPSTLYPGFYDLRGSKYSLIPQTVSNPSFL